MKSNTIKKFDTFVSHNFFGYSAHTLYQELCHSYPAEIVSQWVYVNIWHTFIDQDTPEDIEYCIATHEYERLAVLANDALDLYLKGVISLHEFKLIIAANKN